MQRIIIKNFGPIEDIDISINDIMIFIGPQASGKSTISKVIYFFKSLKYELIKNVMEYVVNNNVENPIGTFSRLVTSKLMAIWGPTQNLSNTYLKYVYKEGIFIEITIKGTDVTYNFSKVFTQTFWDIINRTKLFSSRQPVRDSKPLSSSERISIESERKIFLTEIEWLANELFSDERDVIFFPAGRSLLATFSDQIQINDINKLDYTMLSFIDRINFSKHIFSQSLTDLALKIKKVTQVKYGSESLKSAEDYVSTILKATYLFDNEGEKLYFSKTGYTKLHYASSGQQEVIWILLFIFQIIQKNKDFFVVVEEPEAHLYPETQKDIVDLICLLSNFRSNQIIITTHSPYILSSFNNLLYAYNVDKRGAPNVEAVVNKQLWINPDRLDAYFVSDGRVESIIDEEFKLIKTEAIDSASRVINDVYGKLFDLDPE
ncbi:MAG: AAA family ATPase [Nitrospirae bacterium]|nr:AAA family ATPase [Nitrospirota bacterium]